jgi:hypothetical protein
MAPIFTKQYQTVLYIKGSYHMGLTVVAVCLLMSCNVRELKLLLKNVLYSNSFHTLEQYFQCHNTQYILFTALILFYCFTSLYWRCIVCTGNGRQCVELLYCFLLCLTVLYDNVTRICVRVRVRVRVSVCVTLDLFYISRPLVVPSVDHYALWTINARTPSSWILMVSVQFTCAAARTRFIHVGLTTWKFVVLCVSISLRV